MHSLSLLILSIVPHLADPTPRQEVVRELPLPESTPCVSAAEWREMRRRAEANIARLQARSILPPVYSQGSVLFEWPMRPAAGFEDFGYHAISGFPDLDPSGLLQDYECGQRTYDGHNGTDFVLFPFHWYKMDHDQVEIVAAASGVIIDREDGNNDRSCTPGGSSNKVAIQHADGSRAWYLHMKRFSVTPKQIGDSVVVGEYLGVVGSSGNSALPHLHFDVRDVNWVSFDAWDGPCNTLSGGSRWADQRSYYDSAIVAVRTHGSPPVFPPCPQQETPNYQDEFRGGDTVHFGIYHRDLLGGQLVSFAVLRPDGSVSQSGSYSGPEPHYAAAYALPSFELPGTPQGGTWTIAVDYLDQHYERTFRVRERVAPTGGIVPLAAPGIVIMQAYVSRILLGTLQR